MPQRDPETVLLHEQVAHRGEMEPTVKGMIQKAANEVQDREILSVTSYRLEIPRTFLSALPVLQCACSTHLSLCVEMAHVFPCSPQISDTLCEQTIYQLTLSDL